MFAATPEVPKMLDHEKREIVAAIRVRVEREWMEMTKGDRLPIGYYCILWAYNTIDELRSRGHRAVMQAGSAQWPVILPSQDDGVSDTHFAYRFEPSVENIRMICNGRLPEVHVWAALADDPDRPELIDLTTKYVKEIAVERYGVNWRGPAPPDFIWSHNLPHWTIYEPHPIACQMVEELRGSMTEGRAMCFRLR